jgi:hypothetical protein
MNARLKTNFIPKIRSICVDRLNKYKPSKRNTLVDKPISAPINIEIKNSKFFLNIHFFFENNLILSLYKNLVSAIKLFEPKNKLPLWKRPNNLFLYLLKKYKFLITFFLTRNSVFPHLW